MEEEGVEVVLARATELRLKISNCIHKASINTSNNINGNSLSSKENKQENEGFEEGLVVKGEKEKHPYSQSLNGQSLGEAEEEDEENERLLHIRDALESLEHQLSNLQDLRQQQRYEREVAFSEIEHNRKMLLDKLNEYKGEALEVIQEASAFAGETVEHNNDLLLPPYPSRPPQPLVVDNRHLSHFTSTRKPMQNGITSGEANKNLNELEGNQVQTKNLGKGLGHVIGAAAKTVITLVGVLSVLSLSGFGLSLAKMSTSFKFMGLFRQPATEKRHDGCPPGRVLVLEDGEARCVVKERIAIPFESVVTKPDLSYGSG